MTEISNDRSFMALNFGAWLGIGPATDAAGSAMLTVASGTSARRCFVRRFDRHRRDAHIHPYE
ncbi:MAG: hypothetical protein OEY03_00735 [Rhizobacter sp.]|nr:hypothetical protein [Rhizobacter sp.]